MTTDGVGCPRPSMLWSVTLLQSVCTFGLHAMRAYNIMYYASFARRFFRRGGVAIFSVAVGLLAMHVVVTYLESVSTLKHERDNDRELHDLCHNNAAARSPKMRAACLELAAESASPIVFAALLRTATTLAEQARALIAAPFHSSAAWLLGIGVFALYVLQYVLGRLGVLRLADRRRRRARSNQKLLFQNGFLGDGSDEDESEDEDGGRGGRGESHHVVVLRGGRNDVNYSSGPVRRARSPAPHAALPGTPLRLAPALKEHSFHHARGHASLASHTTPRRPRSPTSRRWRSTTRTE